MKTQLFLILCVALNALASDLSCKVERGLSILKTWKDGLFVSEVRQCLTECTNLYQQEKYVQESGAWTQKLSQAWYSGNGTMPLREGWVLEWECDGDVVSNHMDLDSGAWSLFSSGGNQGAVTVVNGAERTQIINAAILRAEWRTNGTVYSCPNEDDQGTMILWYRTNAPVGLPWFVGLSCELTPGERKSLRIPTPVDCVWRFMGTDKCVSCGKPCWLAAWPQPAAKTTTSTMTASSDGSFLQLSFSGAPGASYALKGSFNLRDWAVLQIVESDGEGGVDYRMPAPAGPCFFRTEAVQTTTMSESETAEVLKEIREFNNQP